MKMSHEDVERACVMLLSDYIKQSYLCSGLFSWGADILEAPNGELCFTRWFLIICGRQSRISRCDFAASLFINYHFFICSALIILFTAHKVNIIFIRPRHSPTELWGSMMITAINAKSMAGFQYRLEENRIGEHLMYAVTRKIPASAQTRIFADIVGCAAHGTVYLWFLRKVWNIFAFY